MNITKNIKIIIVQTTCDNKKEAKEIAKVLLKNKLAACIQISKINSFYTWKNELCDEKEFLLSIKTKKENFKKIKRKIKEIHSYDLPEIISIDISNASKEYTKFIEDNSKN